MPRRTIKCIKCKRKFSMPAHLARHMNSIHGGGRNTKVAGRTTRRIPLGRAMISKASTGNAVSRLLGEMDRSRHDLSLQRDTLDAEIQSIEAAMEAMNGQSNGVSMLSSRRNGKVGRPRKDVQFGPRRGRPVGSRNGSLKQAIVKVLKQKSIAMAPREIAAAVKASGYKSLAEDLTKVVSNTLPELISVKKVGRAQYKL